MKTLILWIDAVSKKFVEGMPFLNDLSKKYGIGELKQSFGYLSISGSFFTGMHPDKHGEFVLFKRGKRERDTILKLLPKQLKPYYFNLKRFLNGKDFFAPFIDKDNFIVSRDKNYHHPNSLRVKSIFDYLRENNIKFLYSQWPLLVDNKKTKLILTKNSDRSRTDKFLKLLKKDYSLYFIHLWDMDKYGHEYGTNDPEYFIGLKKQDELIRKIVGKFDLNKDNIILWSDHGMVNIRKYVNLKDKLPKGNYDFFLDSTMARFWFYDEESKNKIINLLKTVEGGHILTNEEKSKFKINFKNNKYGDEIFLMDPGILISPNFFQEHAKGMHGYDLSREEERGFFILNQKVKNKADITDLCPTILDVLGIKYEQMDGKSLIVD